MLVNQSLSVTDNDTENFITLKPSILDTLHTNGDQSTPLIQTTEN